MANTFKNAYLDVTNSAQTIYTAPASTTSIVLTLRATNVDGTNDATVDVRVVDSDGSNDAYIAYEMSVPADTSLELAGSSKIVLDAGDKIQAKASATGDIEFLASYLEITD